MYVVSASVARCAGACRSFYVFRFIGGLAIGASSVLAPVYISEIAPADRRGALTGLFQFNIVFGILVAFVSNFLLQWLAGGADVVAPETRHRGAAGAAVPGADVHDSAERALAEPARPASMKRAPVSNALGVADQDAMLAEFERAAASARGAGQADGCSSPRIARPILLAVLLAMFNQLSGINAILYYLNDIFAAAGFSGVSQDLQAVAIGAANLLATMIALRVIDRVGRKKLLLIGAVGTALAQAGVAFDHGHGRGPASTCWSC